MKYLFPLLFLFISCEEERLYTKSQIFHMAKRVDPTMELIMPSSIDEGIKCSDYGPGCVGGVSAMVLKMPMIAVEFQTEELAKREAMRIGQFYKYNWVFDDVKGEPPLERFVKEAYDAIAPKP